MLVLAAMIAGFAAWHYARQRQVLTLSFYFNVCALSYMVFGMVIFRMEASALFEADLERVGWMCVAAVAGFNIAYLIANLRRGRVPWRQPGYLPSHTSMLVVVGIGFAFELSAIVLIGVLEYLFVDRIERFAVIRTRIALLYMANLINVCLPIIFMRYLEYRQRRDYRLLLVLAAHGLFLGLATISRHDMMIVLLAAGYFLERYYRIRPVPLLCIMLAALGSTLFYKPILYQLLLGFEYSTDFDYGEYTNWLRHTLLLLQRPDVELPHGGYALALKSLFVMRPEEDSLAEWFLQEFFMERLLLFPGTSYGFSPLWEGYSANGLIGVAMHFAFFGVFFGWLERSRSPMRHVFIVFAMFLTYRLFRAEAYNFVKSYAWYFAYPAVGIVLADRFLTWASGARRGEAVHLSRDVARGRPRRGSASMRPGRRGAVSD